MADEQTHEPELDLDGLEKSLDELVSVADATELHKAYGGTSVEYSGRYDEDGKGGGGQAGGGDVGGLDDMMIAKMSDAGIPAGLIAEFAAFMEGDEEEEEEEEESGKMGEYEGGGESYYRSEDANADNSDDLRKALDEFRQDSDIADAIDVSPFLEALVSRTADQMDAIRKSHDGFEAQQAQLNKHLAVAVHQVGTMLKSQTAVIHELASRLGMVERQPAQPRGATTLTGAQAMAKSMPGEALGGGDRLSKSEALATLSYMNLEKGIKQINGRPTFELVCMYDGGAPIDGQVVSAVETFLRTHPHEADAARNYA
jgi:hypothetical protein